MAYFKCKGLTQYFWRKWDSSPIYAQSSSGGYHYFPYTELWYIVRTTTYSVWGRGSGYGFDSNTGKYTIYNGQSLSGGAESDKKPAATFGNKVCGYPNQGQVSSVIYEKDGSFSSIYISALGLFVQESAGSEISWTQRGSYISSYQKGTTDYGIVKSTDKNAHPANGRDETDGYWYVKVS